MSDIIALVFFATLAKIDDCVEIEVFGEEHEKYLREYWELSNEILSSDKDETIKKILVIDVKTQRGNRNKNQKGNHIVIAVDEN